jgi:hypothetical protein
VARPKSIINHDKDDPLEEFQLRFNMKKPRPVPQERGEEETDRYWEYKKLKGECQ